MAGSITLLGGNNDAIAAGTTVGLLFECAPDASAALRAAGTLSLRELLGESEVVKQRAAALARRFLMDEPPLRGVRQLTVFEELLIRELVHLLEVQHLHDVLLGHGFDHCCFTRPVRHARTLQKLAVRLGSGLRVTAPASRVEGRLAALKRSLWRLRSRGFSREGLGQELEQVLARVDPWQRRLRGRQPSPLPGGGIWFYSTAFTFTRIGLLYEPWLPQPLQFLVDNPYTGGLPLAALGRPFVAPGCFGTRDMEPSTAELDAARVLLRSHLDALELAAGESVLRDMYVDSEAFATFEQRLLPQALFNTRLFERIVRELQPMALVVGNPGFEAPALLAARAAGVPTLLLQHGILGDYTQFVDPPADHYIVRGSFWADFLAPAARARARVLNPPESASLALANDTAIRSVLFLTTPYDLQALWDSSDLEDILRVLLETCRQENARLVVRVHPLEAIGRYQQLVTSLLAGCTDCPVSYSQGAGLESLVAAASVAVTYASTAFLDCLRHQVPIVSFDWHEFSYKRQIQDKGVFHFATSLRSLQSLVARGLRGELPPFREDCTLFLAAMEPDRLRTELAALIGGKRAP